MTAKKISSRTILEVERAMGDLRRGQPVVLKGAGKKSLLVKSGEHYPETVAVTDATHPAVQLMKFAGLLPRAVVSPVGAGKTDWLTVTASAISNYPAALAASLERVSEATVPLKGAVNTRIIAYRPRLGHEEHLAVVIGNPKTKALPYVRIHSSCVTGDVFSSLRCDCGNQLHEALRLIHKNGAGVIIYLNQEGRGIGIANKLRAYVLQDKGRDTVEANEVLGFEADERDYALAANILKDLGIKRLTLITNNPLKIKALTAHGIVVAKRLALITARGIHNRHYLETKARKLGHQL